MMTGGPERRIQPAEVLFPGPATGSLLVLAEPLSFWGGVDSASGLIVDRNHQQVGTSIAGTALLTGASRGSSSSSSTLLECIRRGTAPTILLLLERDTILTVGVAAAWEIYQRGPAVVLLDEPPAADPGDQICVTADGRVSVSTRTGPP